MRVPSDAWKTLRGFPPYARITVGWITLRLSTEGAGGSSLLHRHAHAGFPSMMPGKIAGPRAGAGRRVENAVRFSTLRTVTVGWITLRLSTEGAGGSSLLLRLAHGGFPSMMPGKIAGRVLAPADAWKTLRGFPPYARITIGWITLRLSTEGTGGSSLLPRPAHGGFPSMMPGQIAGPRAGVGRRVENAVRFSTLRADNRRVDNAPLIHRRRWRIEPVTSACARRLP